MTRAGSLFLAILAVMPAGESSAQIVCADCDGTTTITILDALVAAQHAAGLIVLSGPQFVACDVDLTSSVTVLDALVIAQVAAGLPASLMCNQPPSCVVVQPLAGSFASEVTIEVDAVDPDADPLYLDFRWSTDAWATWSPCSATLASPLSNPASGVTPGAGLVFEWDALADVPAMARPATALLRVIVADYYAGASCASGSIDLVAGCVATVAQWTQLTPSGVAPGARYYCTGAWDTVRSRMVVHGGTGTELWFYDPAANAWTQGPACPGGASTHHTIVYDPRDDCIFNWNGDSGQLFRCDFSTTPTGAWTPLTPGGAWPSGHWGTMVYDTANDRIVWAGSQSVGDALWELPISPGGVPGSWNALPISGATYGTRWGWRADYDPVGQRMVCFSGNPSSGPARVVAIDIPAGGPHVVSVLDPPSNPHSFWYSPVWFDGDCGHLYIWSGTYSGSTCDYATRVDLAAPAPIYEPVTMGALNPPRRYATALAHDRSTRTVYIFAGREDAGGATWSDLWKLDY